MATFVLIHGGGGTAAGWDFVKASLTERGHEVVAVDLPCDDPSAGWSEYTNAVVNAVGEREDLVVVAHSAGGFVAPLACEQINAELMVFVAGMVPAPGETFMEWWTNTGYEEEADEAADFFEVYYHDVPRELALADMGREEGRDHFPSEKWPLRAWPNVPSRFILLKDDRCFPSNFMRRVVRERLGITPDEISGSHMAMLSRPDEVAGKLDALWKETG